MAEPKPRQTSQPPLWRDPARLLALLPGIAAVGLAAIYGVGAVLWVAELSGAELALGQVMPLIPVEQILARGIATVALGGVAAVIAGGVLAGVLRVLPPRPDDQKLDPRSTIARVVLVVATIGVVAASSAIMPPVLFTGVTLVMVWLIAAYWKNPDLDVPPRRLIGYSLVIVVVLLLAQTVLDPDPLRRVRLAVEGAPDLGGRLITSTGEAWYLVTAEDHMTAVPASRIVRACFDAEPRGESSTFGEIFGCELL